eukprot:g19586.t1
MFGTAWCTSKLKHYTLLDENGKEWGTEKWHEDPVMGWPINPEQEGLAHKWVPKEGSEHLMEIDVPARDKMIDLAGGGDPMEVDEGPGFVAQEPNNVQQTAISGTAAAVPAVQGDDILDDDAAAKEAENVYEYDEEGKKHIAFSRCAPEAKNIRLTVGMWCEVLAVLHAGSICAGIDYLDKRNFYDSNRKKPTADEALGQKISTAHVTMQSLWLTMQKLAAEKAGAQFESKAATSGAKLLPVAKKEAGPKKVAAAAVARSIEKIAKKVDQGSRMIALVKPGCPEPEPMPDGFVEDGLAVEEDPYENDTEVNRQCFKEADEHKAEQDAEKLREEYEADDADETKKKTYDKCISNFSRAGVDLCVLHAKAKGKKWKIHCRICKKPVAQMEEHYIGANAPQLRAFRMNSRKVGFTRQNGPATHLPHPQAKVGQPRCYCGYHKEGAIYTTVECTELVPIWKLWMCCFAYAENKARFEKWACNCGSPIDPKTMLTLAPSETFGKRSKLYKKVEADSSKAVTKPKSMTKNKK